jgi:hypothetical protein
MEMDSRGTACHGDTRRVRWVGLSRELRWMDGIEVRQVLEASIPGGREGREREREARRESKARTDTD